MKTTIVTTLVLVAFAPAFASDPQDVCGMGAPCPAGSHVVTYADKANSIYACPSRELSDYIGTVIGLTAAQSMLGALPNLAPDR